MHYVTTVGNMGSSDHAAAPPSAAPDHESSTSIPDDVLVYGDSNNVVTVAAAVASASAAASASASATRNQELSISITYDDDEPIIVKLTP